MPDDKLFNGIILGASDSERYVSSWILNQVVIHHDHPMITDHNRCPSSEIPEFTTIQGMKLNIRSHKSNLKAFVAARDTPQSSRPAPLNFMAYIFQAL